jgi:hypothetical protein
MTTLCPSCREPLDYPSGDGCAAMPKHQPHQYPSPEAIVMLKPLHWEDADEGFCTKWKAAALGGHYELVWFEDKQGFSVNFSWGRPLSFWFIQGEPDEYGPTGPKSFTTLDQAKAAAQADYEARILSALEPTTPSPEAIVRAALESAAEKADELGCYCTGCGHICGDPERDLRILQRAGAVSCCPERKMEPLSLFIRSLASDPAEVAAIIMAAGETND